MAPTLFARRPQHGPGLAIAYIAAAALAAAGTLQLAAGASATNSAPAGGVSSQPSQTPR